MSDGVLFVGGDDGGVPRNDEFVVVENATDYVIKVNTTTSTFNKQGIRSLSVSGGRGDDVIRLQSSVAVTHPAVVYGGDGKDVVLGGNGNDTIYGGAGSDVLYGGYGNDVIDPGTNPTTDPNEAGTDKITVVDTPHGQPSQRTEGDKNFVDGGDGNDTFFSGLGDDEFRGGGGVDTVNYSVHVLPYLDRQPGVRASIDGVRNDGYGSVFLYSGNSGAVGADERDYIETDVENVTGTANADTLSGNAADNVLNGGGGDDRLEGLAGNDTLNGGDGSDTLLGGDGHDLLQGENGTDTLDGGLGNDRLVGGANFDAVDYRSRFSNLVVKLDGAANDGQAGEYDNVVSDLEQVLAGSGNDLVVGDARANQIFGGAGNDTIRAGAGNDSVYAGNGADYVVGEDGDDLLDGQNDNDTIFGNAGRDNVLGGAGHDNLDGGVDNDRLDGQAGDDILRGHLGDDALIGGVGKDSLYGQDGNDTLNSRDGERDFLNGGAGTDKFQDEFWDDSKLNVEFRLH